jgi:hypothetical protein
MHGADDDAAAAAAEHQQRLVRGFRAFVRRVEGQWLAERDSQPYGITEGQAIMAGIAWELAQFRSDSFIEDHTDIEEAIDQASLAATKVNQYRLVLGQESYDEFWHLGDQVIESLKHINQMLLTALQ